jgi:hypothetical protein
MQFIPFESHEYYRKSSSPITHKFASQIADANIAVSSLYRGTIETGGKVVRLSCEGETISGFVGIGVFEGLLLAEFGAKGQGGKQSVCKLSTYLAEVIFFL